MAEVVVERKTKSVPKCSVNEVWGPGGSNKEGCKPHRDQARRVLVQAGLQKAQPLGRVQPYVTSTS